jgi:hypothetical protein
MRLRLRALVPALVLGGALVAPPTAEADGHRRSDRGRRYGYERSDRGDHRGRSHRSYRRGQPRGHNRHQRPHYRRYQRGFPHAYPGPVYGPPPYRGGVHGSVSIGLPFVGFSLHF